MRYIEINADNINEILSASPQYKKGDRVIANFNTAKDPEYYVGTVTGIRKGLVYVVFDDGDKHSFKPTRSLVGLVGITKKKTGRKSQIPTKDINKWLSIDIGKASPKRKSKPNVVDKKSSEKENKGRIARTTRERGAFAKELAKEYADGKSIMKIKRENPNLFDFNNNSWDNDFIKLIKNIAISKFGKKKPESKFMKLLKEVEKTGDRSKLEKYQSINKKKFNIPF